MFIKALQLENYRCYKSQELILSKKINVLIGENNSGKSAIIKAIRSLQENKVISSSDTRINEKEGFIAFYFGDIDNRLHSLYSDQEDGTKKRKAILETLKEEFYQVEIGFEFDSQEPQLAISSIPIKVFPSELGKNFIFPFLSKRKTFGFNTTISAQYSNSIDLDLSYIIAKIDTLLNVSHPAHKAYKKSVKDILGLDISTYPSYNGKEAGLFLLEGHTIKLEELGEGVSNILGLITILCMGENHLFVLEEIENDIHPRALKGLLQLIKTKSKSNQFIISTHSNIVLKELGESEETKIFHLKNKVVKGVPTTKVNMVISPFERQKVLEELGYSFEDWGLQKGWLLFEESSAERIVNEFLIPWFTPKIRGLMGTISSNGYQKLFNKFDELHSAFLYLHKASIYKNKVWLFIDGGIEEKKLFQRLKEKYIKKHDWNESNFIQLTKHDFEDYYPSIFQERVQEIKNIDSSQKKRRQEMKTDLLLKLIKWCSENPELAKNEFSNSASEVVDLLKSIEASITR